MTKPDSRKDFAAVAECFISAYNAKDMKLLESLMAPGLDFEHFNRNFRFKESAGLIEVLQQFASALVPDRHFLPPDRVTVIGNIVVREGYYTGTAKVDLPGFASAGGTIRLKFCSVMRFSDDGVLVEWKDYG
jgi:hypothetical protein